MRPLPAVVGQWIRLYDCNIVYAVLLCQLSHERRKCRWRRYIKLFTYSFTDLIGFIMMTIIFSDLNFDSHTPTQTSLFTDFTRDGNSSAFQNSRYLTHRCILSLIVYYEFT